MEDDWDVYNKNFLTLKKNQTMKITKILFSVLLLSSLFIVGCKPKDADIKASIENKLKTDADVNAVMVDVSDGVATLSGICKDDASKMKAESDAKDVKGVKSVVNNITMAAPPPPTVEVSADNTLTQGVMDATKDFPTVKASVNDGVITLTGDIARARLQTLMQSLNMLKPKKIQNQLTIK